MKKLLGLLLILAAAAGVLWGMGEADSGPTEPTVPETTAQTTIPATTEPTT